MMRFWCLSTSKENWEICKQHLVWGMDFRYFIVLRDFVRSGDKAIVYTKGGEFVAVVEFVGEMKEEFTHIGWTKKGRPAMFPYRIGIRTLREGRIPISFSTTNNSSNGERALWPHPNFIDKLVFIADKGKTWNQYVQVSIANIPEEDYELVESNL